MLLLLSSEWRNLQRRWRILRRLEQCSTVPWLLLTLVILESSLVTASSYHPAIVQPPPQYARSPPPSPRSYPPLHPGGQNPVPTMLTGPSPAPNHNLYYTIDQGNKLMQRQMPAGPSGITAAATNYLLQQLQNEQLQQQRSIVSQPRPQPQVPPQPIASASSQQQQTLQLLANLTPQQIAALQTVLPTLPRSAPAQPQPIGIPVPVPVGAHSMHQTHGESPNPQLQFAARMGPFDKIFNKAKNWFPDMMHAGSGHGKSGNGIGEPKMRDLHRLPKPPKYPLYDLPSIGQATPPPAPVMHPMASLPNSAFDLDQPQMAPPMQSSSPRSTVGGPIGSGSSYNQQNWISPSPTMQPSRRRGPVPPRTPRPSKPSFLRNPLRSKKPRPSPDTPVNYNRRNHGPPPPPPGRQPHPPRSRNRGPPPSLPSLTKPPPKKNGPHRGRYPAQPRRPQSSQPLDPYSSSASSGGSHLGFDHPMASNLSPAQSPALGRPLGYEEYMARPSHSYTDDPWNFDPFASQMNQGLNTHALRYNYDPLGMNALDTEANSHLDPNKLSYPGDSFNQDMVKDSPGIGSTAQIGGWDKPFKKRPYDSNPDTELTPPGQGSNFGPGGGSPFASSPADPYSPPSSLGSSSNRYKNGGSSGTSYQSNSGNIGSGFLGDALSGGRRGEMASAPMDPFEGGSALPSFNMDDQNGPDGAPTIDLDTLSPQQDDDGGLEFTIETSMDKGGNGGFGMEESPQPDPHPLGPMQPPSSPFLSDNYSPYGEQSSPQESSIPGIPYGPNGYSHRDDRREQRYGRRRTRNNSQRRSSRARPQTQFQQRQRQQQLEQQQQQQQLEQRQQQQQQRSQSAVPEGVQIFNEIIRPELEKLQTPSTRQLSNQSRAQAQIRKQLYSAIRQSDGK